MTQQHLAASKPRHVQGKKAASSHVPQEARPDLYTRVTEAIVADLQRGVLPWTKPWSAEHLAGRISRPLRHSGEPYSGINVILLWSEAVARGFAAPIWMTFRQALALGAHVRKGERGATVVYANRIKRTETDDDGADIEREIPFLKAYTVFNVEQIEGLPSHFYAVTGPQLDPQARVARADDFFARLGVDVRHGGNSAYYAIHPDYVQIPPFESFRDPESYYATWRTSARTGPVTPPALTGTSDARLGAILATRARNLSPNSAQPSSAPISAWRSSPAKTTPLTSTAGSRC